jgi:hypothetical protein
MANTLRIKRRVTGVTGAPSTLSADELAFNEVSGGRILYYGLGDVAGVASSVIAIGGPDFTPSSISNLTGVITSVGLSTSINSQTGTGSKFVVDTSPVLVTPNLGTPSAGTLTNCTFPTLNQNTSGTAAGLSATLAVLSGGTGVTTSTGTGAVVRANTPTLITPDIGVATGTSLTLSGNLVINGTTTTIASTTLEVGDKNIVLASASTTDAAADGGGITLKGATDHTWNWVDATDAWTSSDHINVGSTKAYYIAGTSVLNATTLGAAVVASSLTSVGALTSGSLGVGFTAVVVARGGTGVATLTGIVKGNGTSAFTAATEGTDYLSNASTIDGGTF